MLIFVTRFAGEDSEHAVLDRGINEVENAIALCNQSLGAEDWPGEYFLGDLKKLEEYFNRPWKVAAQCLRS